DAARLCREMRAAGALTWDRRRCPSPEGDPWFRDRGMELAVLRTHRGVTGLVVLGRRDRHRELTGEEVSAVELLTEQLVITLDHSLLQAERRAAEHRAAQGEKLSA